MKDVKSKLLTSCSMASSSSPLSSSQRLPRFRHPHQLRQDNELCLRHPPSPSSKNEHFFAIDARFDNLPIIRASIKCTSKHTHFQLLSFCGNRSLEGNEGISSLSKCTDLVENIFDLGNYFPHKNKIKKKFGSEKGNNMF